MKKISIILTLLLFFKYGSSQHSIDGYVLDTNNAPIAGVNLLLSQTSIATVTNYDGYFKLYINEHVDNAKLLIRFIGYAPLDAEIDIENGYKYKLKIRLVRLKKSKKNNKSSFLIERTKE